MSSLWTSAHHLQQGTASQCLVPPVFLSTHCGGSSGGQLCSCISPHSERLVAGQCSRHILEMNHCDYASLPLQDKSVSLADTRKEPRHWHHIFMGTAPSATSALSMTTFSLSFKRVFVNHFSGSLDLYQHWPIGDRTQTRQGHVAVSQVSAEI